MQIRIQNTHLEKKWKSLISTIKENGRKKAGFQYLLYTNEEDEKVALRIFQR